ncbi:MAG: HAD family hydrolase [Acidobacteriota bacterium]
MSVRAVIFDLDGTLLNTLEDLADAGNATLKAFGYPEHPVESYKQFVGDGVGMLVRRAMPAEHMDAYPRVLERMREEYAKHLDCKTKPYPGIMQLLKALASQGIALCVLSNKPEQFCQANMIQFFGGVRWAAIVGESAAIPRKPDPAGALAIAKRLGLAPEEFMFVGDSPMDVACALNAGMTPVGVTWGFRGRDTMEEAGAKLFIDKPEELVGLLRQ